jgi:hypothetical protein
VSAAGFLLFFFRWERMTRAARAARKKRFHPPGPRPRPASRQLEAARSVSLEQLAQSPPPPIWSRAAPTPLCGEHMPLPQKEGTEQKWIRPSQKDSGLRVCGGLRAHHVGLDGAVGGGVGDAGEHEAVAHLVVVQEGLVGLVDGPSLRGEERGERREGREEEEASAIGLVFLFGFFLFCDGLFRDKKLRSIPRVSPVLRAPLRRCDVTQRPSGSPGAP